MSLQKPSKTIPLNETLLPKTAMFITTPIEFIGAHVSFTYINYKDEVEERNVLAEQVVWSATEWHPTPQFMLIAFDKDRKQYRAFAMDKISNLRRGEY